MASMVFTITGVISSVILLAAYIYYPYRYRDLDVKAVLNGLLKAEAMASVNPETRIAVGFGSCLDLVGNGLQVLNMIGDSVPDMPENFNEIHDVNELKKTFAYFFSHGASAGRITKNETLFAEILSIMRELPSTKFTLGGNAPVMAKRFVKEDVKVILAAKIPDAHVKDLDASVSVIGGLAAVTDTHLVLEYERDAVWGKYISKRANRFILYNQNENNLSSLFDDLTVEQQRFQPQILVVGGLRMMLNYRSENGQTGLDELSPFLSKLPKSTRIHVEMSSFPDKMQLKDIIENVVYYADSIGMNEQELPNLHGNLVNSDTSLISDSHPQIPITLDHMRAIFRILHNTEEIHGKRKLTRLHVHTLAYQVIMTLKTSSWTSSMSAVAKAALTANRHTCGSHDININTAMLLVNSSFAISATEQTQRIQFDESNPVSCWTEEDLNICLAPVLVCTQVIQTVGGGDNVSAAGLVLQV